MKKIAYFLLAFIFTSSLIAAEKWDYFTALDKDKDGKVTESEWIARAKVQHKKTKREYVEKNVKTWFKSNDTDGNGTLSRKEVEAITKNASAKKNKKK